MYTLNKDNPAFFDSSKLQSEFVRQATICHGCRLCFNYCPAFPKMFQYTDKKGPSKLTLEDLFDVASDCFHCNMCYVNCPYTPPHEFNMDFPHLMAWAWLYYKSKTGLTLRDRLFEMLDTATLVRPIAKKFLEGGKQFMGISPDAPPLRLADRSFLKTVKPKKIEKPVAKVVLFHTCLVENFYPEIGEDVVEVLNALNIEVVTDNFACCGAPMLDVGDATQLKKNAEKNFKMLKEYMDKGYDVVSPIPTCTLMLTKEYKYILDREPIKVYDIMEYLMKLRKEGKISWNGEIPKNVFYHTPCHLKYLKVGLPGVQAMRTLKLNVEMSNMGCSGIDGGWGLRNYSKAKVVGAKMMDAFANSKADIFATECPLAGLQIEKASGRRAVHPISLLKEVIKNNPSK
ncbi:MULTISPECIES: heterodisulfide reductase-related iron-sulfur binding cluster [Metallosphaera]|uniref:heterodisulfide reductase-related iron-sulfur binding cluster n=1 Tax=Metallosphaera TaxID=41980 RepID=UPI001F06A1C9|nr:heterodisulfide reductase-related iron-sulfur binding cluster [Metallosphaera sedula]MCH1771054.1 glycerol-3-phosphate dehydrogenase [Metallosphaera sedula]MCP6729411.1 heterodisulfide reductase-related iron-sulfur binding cluster [Metallosphaera sedula]MCP6729423.1 heterodisulfide reductase-related iron-sulfur binding cluster [Metallosphaera sedula]